jgi:hypothetical protein
MNEQTARINNDEINRKLDSLKAAVSSQDSGSVSLEKYNALVAKFNLFAQKFNALLAENKELRASLASRTTFTPENLAEDQ